MAVERRVEDGAAQLKTYSDRNGEQNAPRLERERGFY